VRVFVSFPTAADIVAARDAIPNLIPRCLTDGTRGFIL
jgi:hypothetical protein